MERYVTLTRGTRHSMSTNRAISCIYRRNRAFTFGNRTAVDRLLLRLRCPRQHANASTVPACRSLRRRRVCAGGRALSLHKARATESSTFAWLSATPAGNAKTWMMESS